MIFIPERDIARLVSATDCLAAVERVFASSGRNMVRSFAVVREAIGHADALYGIKSGFNRESLALGLKSGGYWPNNASKGITNHQSMIFLFDADTGRCRAVLGGNLLTALRTAAASAVSIKYLARMDSRVLGIVGAGHQSTFQLRAALEQRQFEKVLGWNRTPEKLERLAKVAQEKGVPFQAVSVEQLCASADVIITMTSSFAPIIPGGLIRPGTHLACMGTDTKGKQEIAPEIVGAATVFTDEVEQAISIGEAQHAVSRGFLDPAQIVSIGDVVNGSHPGRRSMEEKTLFDGTGVVGQDLAVASVAVDVAVARGVAIEIDA